MPKPVEIKAEKKMLIFQRKKMTMATRQKKLRKSSIKKSVLVLKIYAKTKCVFLRLQSTLLLEVMV